MDEASGGRQVLRILGLGEDEEAVYRALLRLSAAYRGELARQLGWADDRIAPALDALRERNLAGRTRWPCPARRTWRSSPRWPAG